MLTVTNINNNADSIRVINHGTKFNKTDVLMYAEHITQTKYTRIFKYPARAYVSYKIAGGRAAIRHKIPARREHLLTIEQCATYKNMPVWYTYTDNTPTADIIDEIRAYYSTNNIKYCPAY